MCDQQIVITDGVVTAAVTSERVGKVARRMLQAFNGNRSMNWLGARGKSQMPMKPLILLQTCHELLRLSRYFSSKS